MQNDHVAKPKTSLHSYYNTDRSLEEEGAWITMPDGSRWKLRRSSSRASVAAYTKAQSKHRVAMRRAERMGESPDLDVLNEINRDTLANGIVVDWKGVVDSEGNEIQFSKAKLMELLTELPELALDLINLASEMSNYKAQQDEEDSKNSETG